MEEAKSKFRMLVVTEQLIDYVNNILPARLYRKDSS